jgi:hypothetical protein
MSTSLLSHGWGIVGYQYQRTSYIQGTVVFRIARDPTTLQCPVCESRRVIRRGARAYPNSVCEPASDEDCNTANYSELAPCSAIPPDRNPAPRAHDSSFSKDHSAIRTQPRSRRPHAAQSPPHEAMRYNERTAAERFNSRMKEGFGARNIMVRGPHKVKMHLMFGVIALFADQLLKLVS